MNKVTALREHLGYSSIKDFADFIDINYHTVQKWEKRGNLPDAFNMAKILQKLPNLNPMYFANQDAAMWITQISNGNNASNDIQGYIKKINHLNNRIKQLEERNSTLRRVLIDLLESETITTNERQKEKILRKVKQKAGATA